MKYDTIIWDWNGTLLDDVELAIGVMNRLLHEHGYPAINRELYTDVFDFPVHLYYERVGFDLQQHNFQQLSDRFCADFEADLHRAELFDETAGVLGDLNGHNHFVLSNTQQAALERMLSHYAVAPSFTGVFGLADNRAGGKVGVGTELMRAHDVDAGRAVMIGDTTHDADVAAALGIDCLLVATGHNSHTRLSGRGVPVADSLREVCDLILQ